MRKYNQIAIAVLTLFVLPIVAQAFDFNPPNPQNPTTPVPEPSTYYAGAICLVPLAVGMVRALRKSRK